MYLWKPHNAPSKYKFVEDYIKKNKETIQIKNFEESLKELNSEYYKIYKLRFYDHKSLEYIIKQMGISSTARLTEKLDEIQNILKVYTRISKKQLIEK